MPKDTFMLRSITATLAVALASLALVSGPASARPAAPPVPKDRHKPASSN
jgi:hypothetical protein